MLRFGHVSLIRWIARGLRPCVAAALVASLATTMLGPLVHADDGHDADFAPPVVHDASQHQLTRDVGRTAEPATEQHCVACHVVRLVREQAAVALSAQPLLVTTGIRYDGAGDVRAPVSGPPLPARAPPASLFA